MLQSGKSATMLPSIAASSSGHWNQDGSRGWQRSIGSVRTQAHPDEDIAAKALDQRHAFAEWPAGRRLDVRCEPVPPAGRPGSARSAPDSAPPRVMRTQTRASTSPSCAHRNFERECVVGRIAGAAAHIDGPARCPADEAAAAEERRPSPGEGCRCRPSCPAARRYCRRGRPTPARRCRISASSRSDVLARRSAEGRRATPPGITRSIISRWPKQRAAVRRTRSRSTPQWACISANAASLQIAPMSPRWLAMRSSSAIKRAQPVRPRRRRGCRSPPRRRGRRRWQ